MTIQHVKICQKPKHVTIKNMQDGKKDQEDNNKPTKQPSEPKQEQSEEYIPIRRTGPVTTLQTVGSETKQNDEKQQEK